MLLSGYSSMQFIAAFILFAVFIPESLAVKPYFSLCNPSQGKSECGENAVCYTSSRCDLGRCLCVSDDYRPFMIRTLNGTVYGSDCARLLRLDDNCTDMEAHLINTEAGFACIDGVVTCSPSYFVRGPAGKCVFKKHLKSFREDCTDIVNVTCNPFLGLICINDTKTQACGCPPFQRFVLDRRYPFGGKCTYPGYEQRCDSDEQCSGISTEAVGGPRGHISVCRGPPFLCRCNEPNYVPLDYVIAWENNTYGITKTFCVPNMPVKSDLGGTCWIAPPVLTLNGVIAVQQPIICKAGLVCYSCPEFTPGLTQPTTALGMPLPGRCVSMNPPTSDSTKGVSSSKLLLVIILLAVVVSK